MNAALIPAGKSPALSPEPKVWIIGGADIDLRLGLVRKLQGFGYRMSVAGTGPASAFDEAGIPYFAYRLGNRVDLLSDWLGYRQLLRYLRQHKPDVVHAFDTKPSIFGIAAGARAGVPARIRTITGLGYVFSSETVGAKWLRPLLSRMHRWAADRADCTTFYNAADRDYSLQHGMVRADRQRLIPGSGIDYAAFRRQIPDPEQLARLRQELGLDDRPVVIMIARLIPEKGVREFIAAARQLTEQKVAAQFLLVGPLEAASRGGISARELRAAAPTVWWIGPRSDIPALLAASEICVLPTYYGEGLPRVLLEAGAAARAIVTTEIPACRELITHGVNGLLVPPRNITELAAAIRRLLENHALRQHVADQFHDVVRQKFTLDRIAATWAQIYAQLLRKSCGVRAVPTAA